MLVAVAGFAQGTVVGTVKNADGAGIPFASVELVGTTNGSITDADGKYTIGNVPAGKVTVRASAISHVTGTSEVEVQNGKDTQQDFTLGGDALQLTQTVVTGVRNERSKLESSVSISTLNAAAIQNTGAVTTTEIFRSIPGIRSEASGGEGNTNIAVRGVPISSGGSKYLQLQEDGLPIFMFGDMSFATSDIFLRADQSVNRIEVIRGGSAATAATNSPGGIINFISNTGAKQGGSIATSFGLNYNNLRTDFNFGAPIGDGLSFHVGGFFRQGEGPRTAGFTANQGGQVKANITKQFKNGYARVYYKYLNDRTAAYLPMPMKVTGTNENPVWGNANSNFDALTGTPHSPYLLNNFGLGPDGQPRTSNVADGMHPNSHSIGTEFSFDLDGWKIEDRARLSINNGRFVSPFTAEVGTASSLAASVYGFRNPAPMLKPNANGADSTAYTAATTAYNIVKGQSSTSYAGTNELYAGDQSAMRIHMFDTELNNFDNMMNDVKVSKKFDMVTATVGYFSALQNVNMSWVWNSYLMETKGEGGRLLDVYNGTTNYSQNGLYAYGVPAWGNCCQRSYNTQNTISAPYLNIGVDITKDLNFDGSLRYDMGKVTGTYAATAQSQRDVNGDGIIQQPETSVSVINRAAAAPVNYTYNYLSYSAGLNYKISNDMAVFARHSQGGAAKADRILFGDAINPVTGGLTTAQKDANGGLVYATARPYDLLNQTELGFKYRFDQGGLFVTGFRAAADEVGGYEATTQKYISNSYNAFGVELEGAYHISDFNVRVGATYTNATIVSKDAAINGKTPRRQPALMFNLAPSYTFGAGHEVGLNIYGNTRSFASDENKLVMPGYAVINLFANFKVTKNIVAGVSANNLFNTIGVTESEDGAITPNVDNTVRARSITGRTISASVRYNF